MEQKGAMAWTSLLIVVLFSLFRVEEPAGLPSPTIYSSLMAWAPAPAPVSCGTSPFSSNLGLSTHKSCPSFQNWTASYPIWILPIQLQRIATTNFYMILTLAASRVASPRSDLHRAPSPLHVAITVERNSELYSDSGIVANTRERRLL